MDQKNIECGWQLIYDRMKSLGLLGRAGREPADQGLENGPGRGPRQDRAGRHECWTHESRKPNLEKVLSAGHFAVTAELGPPKSADVEVIATKAGYLKGQVDAVNITDNQTAIVRMSSHRRGRAGPAGRGGAGDPDHLPRPQPPGHPDRRAGRLRPGHPQHPLPDGDHQSFGNHPTAKNVYDLDSIQLIGMLKTMRDEKKFACGDEIRNSKKAPVVEPRIFIGGGGEPLRRPASSSGPSAWRKKVAAGVDFIQTQCIYDMERFERVDAPGAGPRPARAGARSWPA